MRETPRVGQYQALTIESLIAQKAVKCFFNVSVESTWLSARKNQYQKVLTADSDNIAYGYGLAATCIKRLYLPSSDLFSVDGVLRLAKLDNR
jgi:hypothetical protein